MYLAKWQYGQSFCSLYNPPTITTAVTLLLLSVLLIFANTSCPQHHQTILQHSNEKGIYPSATSVALPFTSSMYHFLCLWHIKMPFGYPLTTWFHIPYHI